MDDLNPYEAPKVAKPRAQLVKRTLGVGLVLLFTPPATAIAVLLSCGNVNRVAQEFPWPIVLLGPGFVTLMALMTLAFMLDSPIYYKLNRVSRRGVILLATPLVSLVACGLGLGLALLAVALLPFSNEQRANYVDLKTAGYVFWLPPAIAMLVMLWLAWRAR